MRFLVVVLLFSSSIIFGQTKYDKHLNLIHEADSLINNKDYKKAIIKYEKALNIVTPKFATSFFKLAECALKLKDTVLADKWIRNGITKGNGKMHYLNTYKGFENIQNKLFFKKILSDYNNLRKEYFLSIDNIDLYLEINEMIERDQFVRKIDDIIEGRSDNYMEEIFNKVIEAQKRKDTIEVKRLKKLLFPQPNEKYQKLQRELMVKVDSLNINRLIEITKEHGWQEQAWIILWHQRGTYGEKNYVWDFFKPALNKEIQEGKISNHFWDRFEQFKKRMKSKKEI